MKEKDFLTGANIRVSMDGKLLDPRGYRDPPKD